MDNYTKTEVGELYLSNTQIYEAEKYFLFDNLVDEIFGGNGEKDLGHLNHAERVFMVELLNQYEQVHEKTTGQIDTLQKWVRLHLDELNSFTDMSIQRFICNF